MYTVLHAELKASKWTGQLADWGRSIWRVLRSEWEAFMYTVLRSEK
jgi:hypothetical protein